MIFRERKTTVNAQANPNHYKLCFGPLDTLDGIRENFTEVYKSHIGAVRNTIRRFRFAEQQAEDLAQQVFLTAWSKLHTIKDPKAFSGWIKAITRNQCLNEVRKKQLSISISTTDHIEEGHEAWQVVLEADDNGEQLEWKYSIELLEELIKAHNHPIRKEIAYLFYIDHLSVADICGKLQMNQNTILSHLRRFRIQITKAMLEVIENRN